MVLKGNAGKENQKVIWRERKDADLNGDRDSEEDSKTLKENNIKKRL